MKAGVSYAHQCCGLGKPVAPNLVIQGWSLPRFLDSQELKVWLRIPYCPELLEKWDNLVSALFCWRSSASNQQAHGPSTWGVHVGFSTPQYDVFFQQDILCIRIPVRAAYPTAPTGAHCTGSSCKSWGLRWSREQLMTWDRYNTPFSCPSPFSHCNQLHQGKETPSRAVHIANVKLQG